MSGDPADLWKNYLQQKSSDLKEQLIIHYISLVQRIANQTASYLPQHLTKEDLYSYGIFGLIEAVERYNPELGISFTHYACKRIKGSIIDGIRKEDWVPASVRKKAKLIEQAYQKLESLLQRNARDEEIAEELKISTSELAQWYKDIRYITVLSLDEPLADDESGVRRDSVWDESSPNPALLSEENEVRKTLVRAVGELPEKERLVISLFYYHDLTNKEIAQVLDLSDSRVSQLHTKAIFRLRGKLARMKKHLA